jgi:hypothetical protein
LTRWLAPIAADGDRAVAAGGELVEGLLELLGGEPVAGSKGGPERCSHRAAYRAPGRLTQNTLYSALNRPGASPVADRLPETVTKSRTPCALIVIPAPVRPALPATIMSRSVSGRTNS